MVPISDSSSRRVHAFFSIPTTYFKSRIFFEILAGTESAWLSVAGCGVRRGENVGRLTREVGGGKTPRPTEWDAHES